MSESDERIMDRVVARLSEVLDANLTSIDPDQPLSEIPGVYFDSASALECVVAIEDAFGFTMDFVEDDLRYAFRTLGRIEEFVARKLADANALRF